MTIQDTKISKFMSLVLRHRPELAQLDITNDGWATIDSLLEGMSANGFTIGLDDLLRIVNNDEKQRYAINFETHSIKANQGHSIKINTDFQEKVPPEFLYHGTASLSVASIRASSINKGRRHHVHLTDSIQTAWLVARRRKSPVILVIDSAAMDREGFTFYISDNHVWLCDNVPSRFIVDVIQNADRLD